MSNFRFLVEVKNDSSAAETVYLDATINANVVGSGKDINPNAGLIQDLGVQTVPLSLGEDTILSWDYSFSTIGTFYAIIKAYSSLNNGIPSSPIAGGYAQFTLSAAPPQFTASLDGVYMTVTSDPTPGSHIVVEVDARNTSSSGNSHYFGVVVKLVDSLGNTWNCSSRVNFDVDCVLDPLYPAEIDYLLMYPGQAGTDQFEFKLPDDFPLGPTQYYATLWENNTSPPDTLLDTLGNDTFNVLTHTFTASGNKDSWVVLTNGLGLANAQVSQLIFDFTPQVEIWNVQQPTSPYALTPDLSIMVHYQTVSSNLRSLPLGRILFHCS